MELQKEYFSLPNKQTGTLILLTKKVQDEVILYKENNQSKISCFDFFVYSGLTVNISMIIMLKKML